MRNEPDRPEPMTSQKMSGCTSAPTTRLSWRKKRRRSRDTNTPTVATLSRHSDGAGASAVRGSATTASIS